MAICWSDEAAVLRYRYEIARPEFVDELVALGIEEERYRVALLLGDFAGLEACRVVACDLDCARPVRGGPVIAIEDYRIYGLEPSFVVGSDGRDHYEELVDLAGGYAYLGAGPDVQRADVERAARPIGGDELDVVPDDPSDGLDEELLRKLGREDVVDRAVHPVRVLVRSEDPDRAVLRGERLETLKRRLSVVEADCRYGHAYVRVRQQLPLAPNPVGPGVADVRLDWDIAEAKRVPVYPGLGFS